MQETPAPRLLLKSLRLRDWKSFEDATLRFDAMTVIVGLNASGKSNIVDALEFLKRCTSENIDGALEGTENIPPIRGGTHWAFRHICKGESAPTQNFSLKLSFVTENEEEYEYEVEIEKVGMMIHAKSESLSQVKPNNKSIFNHPSSSKSEPLGDGGFMHSGSVEDLELGFLSIEWRNTIKEPEKREVYINLKYLLGRISVFKPHPELIRGDSVFSKSAISKFLSANASNLAAYILGLGTERQKEVEARLQSYLTRLPENELIEIWSEPIGLEKRDAMLYAKEKVGDLETRIDARAMSDGTLIFIAILTRILTLPEGSTLVLEEVDTSFHPSRAKLLLEALTEIGEERKIDVVITTHNSAFLNSIPPKFFYRIQVVHRNPETGYSEITPFEEIDGYLRVIAEGRPGTLLERGRIETALKNNPLTNE